MAYSLQLYFDFAGYSEMSNGLAALIGFDCPANFDLPYISGSITEFWRRWHITLSGWFRDYIYIPLGGNRKGQRAAAVQHVPCLGCYRHLARCKLELHCLGDCTTLCC